MTESDLDLHPGLHVDTALACAATLAREIADLVRRAEQATRPFVLGCATGSTQHAVYAALVALHRQEGLSLRGVVTFNLDEYSGYGPRSEHSFAHYMQTHLFDHVDIRPHNIHRLAGDTAAADVEAHCRDYELAIESAGGIDLQLLGVGRNGHIAFNEPGMDFAAPTRLVQLDELTRRAAQRSFAPAEVPTTAMTMGVELILRAKALRLLAFGAAKAPAVRAAFLDPISSRMPVSAVRRHRDAVFYVDVAAAAEIPAALASTCARGPGLLDDDRQRGPA